MNMNDITIRIANASDMTALLERDRYIPADVLSKKIVNGEVLVAYNGGIFVGWLRYGLFWDNTPFMNMLFIIDGYRGEGIGKRLTLFWEARMASKGYQTLMTSTQQNETAQHFYTHLHYRAVGGFMQSNGEYEVIFMKEVGSVR
jgi:GNAT superfamily N-acetyltransferase